MRISLLERKKRETYAVHGYHDGQIHRCSTRVPEPGYCQFLKLHLSIKRWFLFPNLLTQHPRRLQIHQIFQIDTLGGRKPDFTSLGPATVRTDQELPDLLPGRDDFL
jgi:hypothetical protein